MGVLPFPLVPVEILVFRCYTHRSIPIPFDDPAIGDADVIHDLDHD
jgi:hypothetical protein